MLGELFFYVIGIYAFLWWFFDNFTSLFQILWNVLVAFIRPNINRSLSERYGNWAVVTGSTDGIGKEYAKQLAQRGINIVLIARNESKLVQVSNEIESLYKVQTKYIVVDFSGGKEIYDRIKHELTVPVGILVNNVGCMFEYPEEFAKIPQDFIWSMVMTNVAAITMTTRLLVNDMKQRGKGIIVNVSSGTSLQPIPYESIYAATKSYVNSFTLVLQRECKPYGIEVQLILPYFISTKMNSYSRFVMSGNIFIPDAQKYSRWAIFTLGKSTETTGYWSHAFQYAIVKILPIPLRMLIAEKMFKYFQIDHFTRNGIQRN